MGGYTFTRGLFTGIYGISTGRNVEFTLLSVEVEGAEAGGRHELPWQGSRWSRSRSDTRRPPPSSHTNVQYSTSTPSQIPHPPPTTRIILQHVHMYVIVLYVLYILYQDYMKAKGLRSSVQQQTDE